MSLRIRLRNIGPSITVLIGFWVIACNSEEAAPELRNYYPMIEGAYLEYKVDSIRFNAFESRIDTFRYFEQRIFERTNSMDDEQINVRVSYRPDTISTWNLSHYERIRKTTTSLEQVIANVRYIRMVFPIELGKIWDGNAGNTSSRIMYRYQAVGEKAEIFGKAFGSCVKVDEGSDSLITRLSGGFAWYADGVGLIRYTHRDIDLTGTAPNGYKLTKELSHWEF